MCAKQKRVDFTKEAPEKLDDMPFYGMQLNEEQLEFANAIWSPKIDIVFCNSVAGTGKTTIAAGVADMLVKYGKYRGIIYLMAPYGERTQGYLPGTLTEKSAVYFEGFYQALTSCGININTVINDDALSAQKDDLKYITCITDTFIRGDTLKDSIVIIDEAQNMTLSQLKKTLTRVTDSDKVVVIGHDKQCDLADKSASGFAKYIEHYRGQERAAICTLTHNYRGWVSRHADALEE